MSKSTIIEIVLFKTNEGVNPEKFQAEMKQWNDFLTKQEGFVSRKIGVSTDGQYIGITYWADLKAPQKFSEKIGQNPEMTKLFDSNMAKIDEKTLSDEFFEILNDTSTETDKAKIVEIIRFKAKEGVNSEEFQMGMVKFNDFLVKQEGFISRKISLATNGQYLDLAYWTDLDVAKTAFEKADEHPGFGKVLDMMDLETELFGYFEIFNDIKTPINYIVTERHETEFTNPIMLTAGEKIIIGEESSEQWLNWVYCTKNDNSNAGWVPKQMINYADEIILENYSAKEMTVEKDEIVEGIKELNGWLWAKNKQTSEIGWIPLENLEIKN
jgi:hypothetical protein